MTPESASRDFGGMIRKQARRVESPQNSEQLAAIVRRAADEGLEVAIRGGGHSQSGQCLTDGIVIDTSALNQVKLLTDEAQLQAQGGARWGDVLHALKGTRHLPHILVNTGEATVGGTLSAGGAGTTSHRFGSQVEQVTQLEVVTGKGERVLCSREIEPDLFDAVRAGQGMFGIITEAWMRLRRTRERVRHYALRYQELERFAEDFRTLAATSRFEHLKAQILPHDRGAVVSVGTEYDDRPNDAEKLNGLQYDDVAIVCDSADIGEAGLIPKAQFNRTHYHPWRDWFLPESALDDILAENWIDPEGVPRPPRCWVGTYAVRRGPIEAPSFVRPHAERWITYSVLANVKERSEAVQIARRLEETDTKIRALGGKSYLSGNIGGEHRRWQRHYGGRYATMRAFQARFDPRGIFKNKHLQAEGEQRG